MYIGEEEKERTVRWEREKEREGGGRKKVGRREEGGKGWVRRGCGKGRRGKE